MPLYDGHQPDCAGCRALHRICQRFGIGRSGSAFGAPQSGSLVRAYGRKHADGCMEGFTAVPFFIEGSGEEEAGALRALAERIGGHAYEATSEQRRYLHIAAVFACNFTNHMYALAHRLLAAHGLPFEAMLPLIDETARKVHELPPAEAQTGPARRYDGNVIGKHLEMLAGEPRLAELYEKISRSIHEEDKSQLIHKLK